MFKALLAASVAMLACCAAAVLAGPMQPPASFDDSGSGAGSELHTLPLYLIALPQPDPASSVFDGAAEGFISVPLSATYDGSYAAAAEDAALLAPPPSVQSAVIPLPSPLYAALALLGVALIARRAMLRSC